MGGAGIDAVDWSAVQAAHGPADRVPGLVRLLTAGDPDQVAAALHELGDTVWHQGTVYGCTPLVVPHLAAVVSDPTLPDPTRAGVALLLAAVASAWTSGDAERDRAIESRAAVAACGPALRGTFTGAPPATRAALVAVLAHAADYPDPDVLDALRPVEDGDDGHLAAAARVARHRIGRTLTDDLVERSAAIDADAADLVAGLAGEPLDRRAAELITELVARVVSARTGATPPPAIPS